MDTAIVYPGSMHDAQVFRSSDIFQKAQNGEILTEPLTTVNGVQILPLLLGYGAYPLLPWLTKPYPNSAILNRSHHRFKVARYSFLKKMEIYDLDPYFWKIITCLKIKNTFVM